MSSVGAVGEVSEFRPVSAVRAVGSSAVSVVLALQYSLGSGQ